MDSRVAEAGSPAFLFLLLKIGVNYEKTVGNDSNGISVVFGLLIFSCALPGQFLISGVD